LADYKILFETDAGIGFGVAYWKCGPMRSEFLRGEREVLWQTVTAYR
jgi:hypothetical protein